MFDDVGLYWPFSFFKPDESTSPSVIRGLQPPIMAIVLLSYHI